MQPYLLVQSDNLFDKGLFYIIIDQKPLPIGRISYKKAFDTLYKTFYVFNIQYDHRLDRFFNFIDVFLYKTPKVNPTGVVLKFEKTLK